jgi:cell division protein FtsL
MDFYIVVCLIFVGFLIYLNIHQLLGFKKRISVLEKENDELKKQNEDLGKEDKVLTLDAKDLLGDLCRGKAVIKITPIDPKYIFEYSPRG